MTPTPDDTGHALAEIPERPQADPLAMIAQAIERGFDAGQLDKLIALQERVERNKAMAAFAEAITAFQRRMPPVHKGKSVNGKYTYATYEQLMAVAGPLLREYGIVVTFDSAQAGEMLRVVCRVRVGIHVEETAVTLPIPEGNKLINATQIFGQAMSYGKRYSVAAALNIVFTDEDQDATYQPDEQQARPGFVTPAQVDELTGLWHDYADAAGAIAASETWPRFLEWAANRTGATGLEEIPAGRFGDVKAKLSAKWREAKWREAKWREAKGKQAADLAAKGGA